MSRPLFALLALAAMLATPLPAEARLGQSITTFRHSKLLDGDTLFRYEGVIGARYRFGGASRCRFGTGLLYIDTLNGTIVQQVLVLTVPSNRREERTLQDVARLFLEDAGLERRELRVGLDALEETLATAQAVHRVVRDDVEVNARLEPRLNSVMLIVGLK